MQHQKPLQPPPPAISEEKFWFQKIQNLIENTSTAALWNCKRGLCDMNATTYIIQSLEEINQTVYSLPISEGTDFKSAVYATLEKLWSVVQKYGTYFLDDFLFLLSNTVYRKNRLEFPSAHSADRLRILYKYFHTFHCKVITAAQLNKEIGLATAAATTTATAPSMNYMCLPPEPKHTHPFRVHGMRLVLTVKEKVYVLYGTFDNIVPASLPYHQPDHFLSQIMQQVDPDLHDYLDCMTLSELFLFNKDTVAKTAQSISKNEQLVLSNTVEKVVKIVNEMVPYDKIQFFKHLLQSENVEVHYITCLLYDLFTITPSASNSPSTTSSPNSCKDFDNMIYDSLPYVLKQSLKNSIHTSIQFLQGHDVTYDKNALTLEQQIMIMRVPERVKEKAFAKLREMKSKADDMTSKSRQYLDGLLRVPFGTVREEPILVRGRQIKQDFARLFPDEPTDLAHIGAFLRARAQPLLDERRDPAFWGKYSVTDLRPLCDKKLKKADMVAHIVSQFSTTRPCSIPQDRVYNESRRLLSQLGEVHADLQKVEAVLDASVYGHKDAKRKIMQVVGQWISARQSGYCFGFEGEPGIGKTSLANLGLSEILKDETGAPRPFHIIALGGCANSSTLEGHNYTYSNSTWGRIVDILMESKCMNPIIYIDELDKVSKTENGKEIIGILMHIIDSSQNAGFQDKYFSGIDIDLSQILFVFSYNNPDDIDKILLDRIHRIQFDTLSLQDKVVIARQYILPSLEKKMGFTDKTVRIEDATIEYIIDTYTHESGIRKAKQLLFDIYSQINLDLLQLPSLPSVPSGQMVITKELVNEKYLKKNVKNMAESVHTSPQVGVMNALYATSTGNGGIIKIGCMFVPANSMLEMKLTGSLGKVFTESMEICKNVAWSFLGEARKQELCAQFALSKLQGIHVHFGDCNTPKEGASASLASALTIYSVFTGRKLRHDIAMTGETNLFGEAKRIGGVEAKFTGGIKAGVRTFFYPVENQAEVDRFMEKVGDKYAQTHRFIPVGNLQEVIETHADIAFAL